MCSAAFAQIEVSLELKNKKVLLHESVDARVKIVNNSSEAIRIGGDGVAGSLDLYIVDALGGLVRRREGGQLFAGTIMIEPWMEKVVSIDMLSAYDFSKALPYALVAIVTWQGEKYNSAKVYMDVVSGMLIKSIYNRIVGRDDVMKKYSLLYLHREGHTYIFLRVENKENDVCYGVYKLGTYIRIQDADMAFDNAGRLHILYQSAPGRFTYHRLSKYGMPEEKKFYSGSTGSIRLQRVSGQDLRLIGGKEYKGDTYTPAYEHDNSHVIE